MNYHSMSLVELKQVAKTRHIKQYYIMRRHELIHLLSMKTLPEEMKIEKMTIIELRNIAKARGYRGFWTMHRDQLVSLLFPGYCNNRQTPADKYQQYQCDTYKHNHPQQHNTKEVWIKDI